MLRRFIALFTVFTLLPVPLALATTTAATSPGTVVTDDTIGTVIWNDPGNTTASDDSRTFVVTSDNENTEYLKATNYGFAIPSGVTIDGIEVTVERQRDSEVGVITDNSVRLLQDGSYAGDDKKDAVTLWSADTDEIVTYGGAADTWGLTWTADQINDSTFGVGVSAHDTYVLIAVPGTAFIDHITITITYSAAASSGGGAGGRATRKRNRAAERVMARRAAAAAAAAGSKGSAPTEQNNDYKEEEMPGSGGTFYFDTEAPSLQQVGIFIPDETPKNTQPILTAQERRKQLWVQSDTAMHLRRTRQDASAPQTQTAAVPPTLAQTGETDPFQQRVCKRVLNRFSEDEKMLERVNNRLERRFGFRC